MDTANARGWWGRHGGRALQPWHPACSRVPQVGTSAVASMIQSQRTQQVGRGYATRTLPLTRRVEVAGARPVVAGEDLIWDEGAIVGVELRTQCGEGCHRCRIRGVDQVGLLLSTRSESVHCSLVPHASHGRCQLRDGVHWCPPAAPSRAITCPHHVLSRAITHHHVLSGHTVT